MAVLYTVIAVEGDYALLRSDEGVEDRVALALLPAGSDGGPGLGRGSLLYDRVKRGGNPPGTAFRPRPGVWAFIRLPAIRNRPGVVSGTQ